MNLFLRTALHCRTSIGLPTFLSKQSTVGARFLSNFLPGFQLCHKLDYCTNSSIYKSPYTKQYIAKVVSEMMSGAGDSYVLSGAEKPDIVFVLGGPGAGKGTQCAYIVKEYGYVHLSAGDLLREERKTPNSKVGELIENCIREGQIVPVEITCGLLEKAMVKSGSKKFLIDGFPRNEDNLQGWDRQMSTKVNLQFILFFDCPEEVCTERCLSRGAAGSGRSDDNLESLKKRFSTYMNSTLPIIQHYNKQNLVAKIDASKSAEEVFNEVKNIFQERT